MKLRHVESISVGALLALGVTACDDGGGGARSHSVPWEEPRAQIIGEDRSLEEVDVATGDECLDYSRPTGDEVADVCIKPQEECNEGESSDVIVDDDGRVLEIVCYPPANELTVEEVEAKDGVIEQNENNAVIVVDGGDDAVDLEGDVAVDANNVVVYGEGPDVSVVDGDVNVDGNNIIVRGVRITGDVDIAANNAFFVQCVIDGNVTVRKNNAVITACDIFGSITVLANNVQLTANHVVGGISIEGQNPRCEENYAATDADSNGVLAESELGALITCAGDSGEDKKPGKS